MDVSSIAIFVLILSCGVLSSPMIQDANPEPAVSTEAPVTESSPSPIPNITIAVESTPPPKNCTTAKDIAGVCLPRQSCEHSTAAIDLTLYATRGYVRPCKLEEVCCPFDAIAKVNQPTSNLNDDLFEFDDDD